MKYIALLRGINVGGKNKVPMRELKACFEAAGFRRVSTYINSGNVLFWSEQTDEAELVQICEAAIEEQFGFRVVCAVISAAELQAAVGAAPAWWGKNAGDKHNTLFVIAPATASQVMQAVGAAKLEYEQVAASTNDRLIFWTAPLETFSRTRYSTIVGTKTYLSITIRNYNTTKKLAELGAAD